MEDEQDAPEGLPREFKAAFCAGNEAGRLRAEQSAAWLRSLDPIDERRAQTLADCVARSIDPHGLEIEPLAAELKRTLSLNAEQVDELAREVREKFDSAARDYCTTFLGSTHFEAAYLLAGYAHPRLEEDVENELGMLDDAVSAIRSHQAQTGAERLLPRYFSVRRTELQAELAHLRGGGRPPLERPKLYVTQEDVDRHRLALDDEPDEE